MGKHAKSYRPVVDPLAAYLTLVVAFVQLACRLLVGAARQPRREVRWPTGADEEWAVWLHRENTDPVVRDEARA